MRIPYLVGGILYFITLGCVVSLCWGFYRMHQAVWKENKSL